jgi:hypothetical protein
VGPQARAPPVLVFGQRERSVRPSWRAPTATCPTADPPSHPPSPPALPSLLPPPPPAAAAAAAVPPRSFTSTLLAIIIRVLWLRGPTENRTARACLEMFHGTFSSLALSQASVSPAT